MRFLPHAPAVALCLLCCAALLACSGGRRGRPLPGDDAGTVTVDGSSPDEDAGTPPDGGGIDAGVPTDGGGRDAGFDAGRDAGFDAGWDAGFDAGRDAGFDAGWDAGFDAGPPADTIADIQQGLVAPGATVTVTNVVVTGLYSVGVWVQDPSGGAMHSGVRVYLASAPTVSIGDRVDVTGDVVEYYGETEIEFATLTYRGSGPPIAPTPLTIAQARDEAYEGVLVRLTDVISVNSSYDCSVDDVGCSDPGLWEVRNGTNGIVVYDLVYQDADWSIHVGETPVRGIMGWRYARRRIMPRTPADFGF